MAKKKVYSYRIFPPFIDAYESSGMGSEGLKTIKEIKDLAKSHALSWGRESIGEAVLRTGEVLRHENGKLIVGCFYVWDDIIHITNRNKSYLVLAEENGIGYLYDTLEIIEGRVEDSWDVT